MPINWKTTDRPSGCLTTVKLTICAYAQVNIAFYEEVYKLVTKTKFMAFGTDEERARIYFKEEIPGRGYKLSNFRSNETTATLKVPFKKLPIGEEIQGDYHLNYDNELELYYVDLNKKVEKPSPIVFLGKR